MTPKPWAGRRVARLVAATLTTRGTTCHLCGYAGATSADHDPPRSVLLEAGVLNPDALAYLHPAHLVCNVRRKARPITDELRLELRRQYERDREMAYPRRRSARFGGA